jgi:hypothetical protein
MTTFTLFKGTKLRAVNVSGGGGYTVLFCLSFATNVARDANDGFATCSARASLQESSVRFDIRSFTSGESSDGLCLEVSGVMDLRRFAVFVFAVVDVDEEVSQAVLFSLLLVSALRLGAKKDVIIVFSI